MFFFKQKTAYEMRISDWSSDVCSSDLELPKFNKRIDELTSRADKWVFIFKNLHLLTEPIFTDDPIFQRLFQITDYFNQPEEDRKMIIDRERDLRSEEHTSELQSLMRSSYAVFCLQKKQKQNKTTTHN